tara:strand:+ start:94 stop:1080 length:987 start_codon:yes stop_codon:yes gene_type:complete
MKIIILGAGSFIGQLIFAHYLQKGHRVIGINRSKPNDIFQWPRNKENQDYGEFWYKLNIVNDNDKIIDIVNKFEPHLIIDFMGQGMVAPSWNTPELWYDTNLSKKAKLLNSFTKLKNLKKYIRASTPEVYGSNEKFLEESSNFNPSTPYAVSHAAIDFHLRCLGKQYNFPYIIGRFANFYGIGQQLYRVIPKLFLSCLTKKKFILDGGGKSLRSFIYGRDLIKAFDLMINSNHKMEEFNFSSQEEISISSLVDKICYLTKTDREKIIIDGPERPGKDMYYRLQISKAEEQLNWTPEVMLDEGLGEVYSWLSNSLDELATRSWDFRLKS